MGQFQRMNTSRTRTSKLERCIKRLDHEQLCNTTPRIRHVECVHCFSSFRQQSWRSVSSGTPDRWRVSLRLGRAGWDAEDASGNFSQQWKLSAILLPKLQYWVVFGRNSHRLTSSYFLTTWCSTVICWIVLIRWVASHFIIKCISASFLCWWRTNKVTKTLWFTLYNSKYKSDR